MYFNKLNSFYHGIMFHHFHDEVTHPKSQGSISKDDFYKIINYIGKENILDADIFFERFKNKKLKKNQVCLTFDDGIKCQIDVALPVLEDLKIKSFFFTYTSLFDGEPDNLEVFRYFRTNNFSSIDKFYKSFFDLLDMDLDYFFEKNKNNIKQVKRNFPFYSIEDIRFRLVRDTLITKQKYENTIKKLMDEKKFKPEKFYSKLFFNTKDVINLDKLGHLVGLHSHSHPTLIERLSYEEQKIEYEKSLSIISRVLGKPKNCIKYMSHPCGSYNGDTLKVLKELGIELGFKQIMTVEPEKKMETINNSFLEVARQDHIEILKEIKR